jgi:hypothetical protein
VAATKETTLNLFLDSPFWASSPLFSFLFPIARHAISQFQSPKNAPQVKTQAKGMVYNTNWALKVEWPHDGMWAGIRAICRQIVRDDGFIFTAYFGRKVNREKAIWKRA